MRKVTEHNTTVRHSQ